MRSSTSRSIAPSLFLLYKMQSLELTHLKYDPNPFLVFSACQFWLPVSITSSSWENKAVSVLKTLITVCCALLKMKCDTYPYFKSLVVHAISAGLDYVFELDAVAFCWKKEKKKKACSLHMQQPSGKHPCTTKPGMPNNWQAVFLSLCR